VDFPIDGLDMTPYLAPTKGLGLKVASTVMAPGTHPEGGLSNGERNVYTLLFMKININM
jgi:hypothetical protein